MSWSSVLIALLVSHVAGDVLLQTDWQAVTKAAGLRRGEARPALLRHVATYTIAYVPALVWIGTGRGAGRAVAVAALVAIPHLLIDDGWLVRSWIARVKGAANPGPGLLIAVDQSFHVLCLLGAALLAVA